MRPPEKIYLQLGGDAEDGFDGVIFPNEHVTWCADRIDSTDVEYIIAPREKRLKRWKDAKGEK